MKVKGLKPRVPQSYFRIMSGAATSGGVSMGLRPTLGNEYRRRPRESGDPLSVQWIPAFAGMTQRARFSGDVEEETFTLSTLHSRLSTFDSQP
ncbi:hypothetical protein SBA2_490011 [Acidobacteriia bacterium SbA2]|nr:hypothetical protein SBA2_490011 [Acidobacteriia bacterium SbA2]